MWTINASLSALLLVCGLTHAAKLNIPKVLLPLARNTKINFTLEATEGCYRWSSNRPEVASVESVEMDARQCSQKAVLQARSNQPVRLTSIILAEDILTGQVLRCDAIVDIISEIQIVSTTRELHLEDSPLELKIQALDSEGNTFSTLASLLFEWNIVKDAEMTDFPESYNTLRVLRFGESSYIPPPYISAMEQMGHKGDIILVSGIKTGHAKLKAKLQEALYKDVAAAEIRLLILENILLSPAYDVYLLPGTSIKYRVQKIRQGKITELAMPCDQYELHLKNSVPTQGNPEAPVAELNQTSSTVFALQHGHTNIILDHKSLRMQGASRLPNGTIYIVDPGYLVFKILPGDRWVLQTERSYEIFVEVFDKAGHNIFLSDNIRIEVTFPVEYFDIIKSSTNGSHHHVKALKPGQTTINGQLNAVFDKTGRVHQLPLPVRNEQDIEIYDPIVLTPAILTFPWQPVEGAYQYPIKATGGSGNFSWSSTNSSVATVIVTGVISTARDIGVSVIYAHDVRNPLHYGEMKIHVIEPVKMEFGPCAVEARLGSVLELPLRFFGYLGDEMVSLTDCSLFDLRVQMERLGIFQLLDGRLSPGQGHCSGVRVEALTPGYTTLVVSYTLGNVHLMDKITIAAYPLLKPLDPASVAVVTLGSSKDMIFEGGPRPWVLEPSKFFRTLTPQDKTSVALSQFGPTSRTFSQHSITATCRALGEHVLELTVGNQPSMTNPIPAVEPAVVRLVCTPPSRLSLTPIYRSAQMDVSCPLLQEHKLLVPVSNHHNAEMDLVAFDQQGRKFDNFSSLTITWESSRPSLASFEQAMPIQLHVREDANSQKKLYVRRTVLIHQASGVTSITVTAVDYDRSHLQKATILSGFEPLTPVSSTLELLLVEDVTVTPSAITIYNHPDVQATLTLLQGSGYFNINTSVTGLADISFLDSQGTAQVVPLQAGILQVMVHDLCLAFPTPAVATVHISDILEVYVRVVDKVEIGESIKAYVRVLDGNKKPFHSKFLSFMNLKLRAASSIVSLQRELEFSEEDTAMFLVKGVQIGQTSISAVVMDRNGKKISSAPQQIEVFPPFRLLPRKVTLIIGAMMQITSEGGPQPQSNILFSLSSEKVASVSTLGHVHGLAVGNITVTGVVQAVDMESGKLVAVSEDHMEVEVLQLTGIQIRAPITRMKTGTTMPVYVMGLTSSQTPFSFGNAVPGFTFHWSLTKRDVLELQTRHAEASVHLAAEHNFAMSVLGRSKGRTGLRVQLKPRDPQSGDLKGDLLQDEIQIQVYEKLLLLNPEVHADEILMFPNSQLKLQTNRDSLSSLSYSVLDCGDKPALIQISDEGIVTSGSLTGKSSLQISSQENFGINQTVIVSVKVVTVSYLRLSTAPVMFTSSKETVSAIPLGAVLTFSVHFHDGTGEILHSHGSLLTFSTNRDDLVQISRSSSNSSLTVRTVNIGLTLLAVWDSDQTGLADFLALPVRHAIYPSEAQQLVVGDVVCFSAQFVSREGVSGVWSSSSSSVLDVDPQTGVAVARDTGPVTVYYEIAGQLRTYREVVISAVTQGAVMLPSIKTNGEPRVLISTRETGNNLIGTCSSPQVNNIALMQPQSSVGCHLRFTSSGVALSPQDVYLIHTAFDSGTGFYSCSLNMKGLNQQQVKVLSLAKTDVEVTVDFHGSLISGEQASVRVPVNPGIYTDQTDIMLSDLHESAELTVYGTAGALQRLHVRSSSPAVLVQEQEVSKSFIRYTVSALNPSVPLMASVSVRCSSSQQVLLVPVSVSPGASTGLSHGPDGGTGSEIFHQFIVSYHVMFLTLFGLLAVIAVSVIGCHVLFSPREVVAHPAFIQKSPSTAGPFNISGVSSSGSHGSPRLRLFSPDYSSR